MGPKRLLNTSTRPRPNRPANSNSNNVGAGRESLRNSNPTDVRSTEFRSRTAKDSIVSYCNIAFSYFSIYVTHGTFKMQHRYLKLWQQNSFRSVVLFTVDWSFWYRYISFLMWIGLYIFNRSSNILIWTPDTSYQRIVVGFHEQNLTGGHHCLRRKSQKGNRYHVAEKIVTRGIFYCVITVL